jgi:hypothetical protein
MITQPPDRECDNATNSCTLDDDVGKFACPVCRKRFTRSDLLNRHRRIHGETTSWAKFHVTPSVEYPDMQDPQSGFDNLVYRDDHRSISEEGSGSQPPPGTYTSQLHQQSLYGGQQDAYQHRMGPDVLSGYEHTMLLQPSGQVQGLTSLVEAALAPQDSFVFHPVENRNPSTWDGFMLYDNTNDSYMGAFDADMTWTLDQFDTESSSDYVMNSAMLGNEYSSDPYPQIAYQPPDINQIGAADAVDVDINDWPDKTSRPGIPNSTQHAAVQLLPTSWQSVLDEARASGLSPSTIAPAQQASDGLRSSLMNALNGTHFPPNEASRPEIGDGMFPPAEALDFFLRLSIKYLQPRFPVLHLPTFDIYTAPPLLLVALMLTGSCHSTVDQGRVCRIFHRHLRISCLRMLEADVAFVRPLPSCSTMPY